MLSAEYHYVGCDDRRWRCDVFVCVCGMHEQNWRYGCIDGWFGFAKESKRCVAVQLHSEINAMPWDEESQKAVGSSLENVHTFRIDVCGHKDVKCTHEKLILQTNYINSRSSNVQQNLFHISTNYQTSWATSFNCQSQSIHHLCLRGQDGWSSCAKSVQKKQTYFRKPRRQDKYRIWFKWSFIFQYIGGSRVMPVFFLNICLICIGRFAPAFLFGGKCMLGQSASAGQGRRLEVAFKPSPVGFTTKTFRT